MCPCGAGSIRSPCGKKHANKAWRYGFTLSAPVTEEPGINSEPSP